jgi:hypothetical protein
LFNFAKCYLCSHTLHVTITGPHMILVGFGF